MNILVDHSGYHLRNLGDVAMLQASVSRLQNLWPDATISVIIYDVDRLAQYCPTTIPLGRNMSEASSRTNIISKVYHAVVQFKRIALPWYALIATWPAFLQKKLGEDAFVADELIDAIRKADLVVASGGGYITDSFKVHGIGILNVLGLAARFGKPTVMFGQGIGPLTSLLLRYRAASVLPRVNMIALREGYFGSTLLKDLGVQSDRIIVTGDDAIEMAYAARPAHLGTALGINLRATKYAGVDDMVVGQVHVALQQVTSSFNAKLLPIPISYYSIDSDVNTIQQLLVGQPSAIHLDEEIDTPQQIIERIGHCRVVVTGSYHAAVFALAQGIPAICLTRSSYYDGKFVGLATQFQNGCSIISLNDSDLTGKLAAAIEQAWQTAEQQRPMLLAAAAQQITAAHTAYQRVYDLVEASLHKHTNGMKSLAAK